MSTEEQAIQGYSLGYQEELLKLQCQKDGLEIVEHFQDDGFSAKSFNRPAFKELCEYIKLNPKTIDFVYVVRRDRFSRNIAMSNLNDSRN